MLISLAELAMLKNVSRAAVTKKIKSGRLEGAVVNHNGRKMVNKEEAFRLWDIADSRAVSALSQTSSEPTLTSGRVENLISKLLKPKSL